MSTKVDVHQHQTSKVDEELKIDTYQHLFSPEIVNETRVFPAYALRLVNECAYGVSIFKTSASALGIRMSESAQVF